MAFGEHVWRKEKEQSFLETSRKDDHMPCDGCPWWRRGRKSMEND